MGNLSKALSGVATKRVENHKTFGPKSHVVDPMAEGWLNSWKNSALQITGSTTSCPGLGGYPIRRISFLSSLSFSCCCSVVCCWALSMGSTSAPFIPHPLYRGYAENIKKYLTR